LLARREAEEEVLRLGTRQVEEGVEPVLGGEQSPGLAQIVRGEPGLVLGFAAKAHGLLRWEREGADGGRDTSSAQATVAPARASSMKRPGTRPGRRARRRVPRGAAARRRQPRGAGVSAGANTTASDSSSVMSRNRCSTRAGTNTTEPGSTGRCSPAT